VGGEALELRTSIPFDARDDIRCARINAAHGIQHRVRARITRARITSARDAPSFARTRHANLILVARIATSAAMENVGIGVDASVAAIGLAIAAVWYAHSIVAFVGTVACVPRRPTIVRVRLQINAIAADTREPRSASAGAIDAEFAIGVALRAAVPAITWIMHHVGAVIGLAARSQPRRTSTVTIRAHPEGHVAIIAAKAAIHWIRLHVDTHAAAFVGSRHAYALPRHAHACRATILSAIAAIGVVRFQVHARAHAFVESLHAYAHVVHARSTGWTRPHVAAIWTAG
jgi:hypothetical protein